MPLYGHSRWLLSISRVSYLFYKLNLLILDSIPRRSTFSHAPSCIALIFRTCETWSFSLFLNWVMTPWKSWGESTKSSSRSRRTRRWGLRKRPLSRLITRPKGWKHWREDSLIRMKTTRSWSMKCLARGSTMGCLFSWCMLTLATLSSTQRESLILIEPVRKLSSWKFLPLKELLFISNRDTSTERMENKWSTMIMSSCSILSIMLTFMSLRISSLIRLRDRIRDLNSDHLRPEEGKIRMRSIKDMRLISHQIFTNGKL